MINIPKGTKDVLPEQSYLWQFIEDTAREVAASFNLREIRTPVFEHTELFLRGVGETTDVVTKEMYTFEDKGGRSITLKPEGTAGVARSFIENGLQNSALPLKAYYVTPCYRYERPQKGRLREFHQFGIETFGSAQPETDAEVIFAAHTFLQKLGIKGAELELNSIGCKTCRAEYNRALKEYFRPHLKDMCATCNDRFEKNPLRIIDCKEEGCKAYTAGAPKILDYLCPDCKQHFEKVQSYLTALNVKFTVNSSIVRGLDYYTRTVFEFVSTQVGTQGTLCGGGRYDGLIEELGGGNVPAIGFAAGLERLLLAGVNAPQAPAPVIYVGGMDELSRLKAFELVNGLRAQNIAAECDLMGRSVKAQLKYADKIGAEFTAIIGGSELESGACNVKRMRDGQIFQVKLADIYPFVSDNSNR